MIRSTIQPAAGSWVWLWVLCIGVMLASAPARAHLFDEGGIQAILLGVQPDDTDGTVLSVTIVNNTPLAVTLRSIVTPEGDQAKIERIRSVLGLEFSQPVRFIRLSPQEWIEMELPAYRVTLAGVTPDALLSGRTGLKADFGPDGQIDLFVVQPFDVEGLSEPLWGTPAPQTME